MHINPLKEPAERVKLTKTELSVLERAKAYCDAIAGAESPARAHADEAAQNLGDVLLHLTPLPSSEAEAKP